MARRLHISKAEGKPLKFVVTELKDKDLEQMLLRFSNGHSELLCMCDHLEDIADRLLAEPDSQKCEVVADNLLPTLKKSYRYEEDSLFPWLATTYGDQQGLEKSLTRLYFEHLEDEAYAGEVIDMLQLIAKRKHFAAETAGYMFRGFFEGLRRHIAFEQDHLYHLIKSPHQSLHNA